MEPMSVDALTALVVRAAAGEVGKSAWSGLLALARRAFSRSHPARAALERAATGEHAAAADAAGHFAAQSRSDPQLAEALQAWAADVLAQAAAVTNSISAQARIGGNVVQARDINGPISFH